MMKAYKIVFALEVKIMFRNKIQSQKNERTFEKNIGDSRMGSFCSWSHIVYEVVFTHWKHT